MPRADRREPRATNKNTQQNKRLLLLVPNTMLRQTATRLLYRTPVRCLSSESVVAADASKVKLNFVLSHETIYSNTKVFSVIIPGVEGEYGVTGGHVPYVAQLKPGVLQILHEELGSEPEKYFVAGGYALTHPDSQTVSHLECDTQCMAKSCHFGDQPNFSIGTGCSLPRSCQAG